MKNIYYYTIHYYRFLWFRLQQRKWEYKHTVEDIDITTETCLTVVNNTNYKEKVPGCDGSWVCPLDMDSTVKLKPFKDLLKVCY